MIKNLPSDLQSLIYSYDKPIKNTLQKILPSIINKYSFFD